VAEGPVIRAAVTCLAHVPDLVRHGSTPRREIARDPLNDARLSEALRNYAEAVAYPPNQVILGNLTPDELGAQPRPWHAVARLAPAEVAAKRVGPLGEILDQTDFYALLAAADAMEPAFVSFAPAAAHEARRRLASHAVLRNLPLSGGDARGT
jgi:betaine reductase